MIQDTFLQEIKIQADAERFRTNARCSRTVSTYCYILFEYISDRFGGYAVVIPIGKCYAFTRNKVEARFAKSTVVLQAGSRNSRRVGKEKTPKASEAEAWPGYMQKMRITVA